MTSHRRSRTNNLDPVGPLVLVALARSVLLPAAVAVLQGTVAGAIAARNRLRPSKASHERDPTAPTTTLAAKH